MPEFAEVEFFRKRWHQAVAGQRIDTVLTHDRSRLFRGTDVAALRKTLTGATLRSSEAAAKQMCFRFNSARNEEAWLGIHLGMTGELTVQPPDYAPGKHDHLVLVASKHALVFTDPRMFGRVEFHVGSEPPAWWTSIAPAVLSDEFTVEAVATFLRRRARAPIKAVMLMQERFPGIGNWMADEILWRAAIHPKRAAGSLTADEVKALWRECRNVCRQSLEKIAGVGGKLPPDLNVNIPDSWLFHHRWEKGGRCPKTGAPLVREEIGGRTTCWSPARQKLDELEHRGKRHPKVDGDLRAPSLTKRGQNALGGRVPPRAGSKSPSQRTPAKSATTARKPRTAASKRA